MRLALRASITASGFALTNRPEPSLMKRAAVSPYEDHPNNHVREVQVTLGHDLIAIADFREGRTDASADQSMWSWRKADHAENNGHDIRPRKGARIHVVIEIDRIRERLPPRELTHRDLTEILSCLDHLGRCYNVMSVELEETPPARSLGEFTSFLAAQTLMNFIGHGSVGSNQQREPSWVACAPY